MKPPAQITVEMPRSRRWSDSRIGCSKPSVPVVLVGVVGRGRRRVDAVALDVAVDLLRQLGGDRVRSSEVRVQVGANGHAFAVDPAQVADQRHPVGSEPVEVQGVAPALAREVRVRSVAVARRLERRDRAVHEPEVPQPRHRVATAIAASHPARRADREARRRGRPRAAPRPPGTRTGRSRRRAPRPAAAPRDCGSRRCAGSTTRGDSAPAEGGSRGRSNIPVATMTARVRIGPSDVSTIQPSSTGSRSTAVARTPVRTGAAAGVALQVGDQLVTRHEPVGLASRRRSRPGAGSTSSESRP